MEQKKRLFIGTFLKTEELLLEYPKLRNEFEGAVLGKWVEVYNLHFTYHFLGEIEHSLVKPLFEAVAPYLREYDGEIKLKGLGCFPSLRSPRVLFVNIIEEKGLLQEIHRNFATILSEFHIELDSREFRPHLTLLRIRSFKYELFQKEIRKYKDFDFGSVTSFRVDLIESKLSREGPTYVPIRTLS